MRSRRRIAKRCCSRNGGCDHEVVLGRRAGTARGDVLPGAVYWGNRPRGTRVAVASPLLPSSRPAHVSARSSSRRCARCGRSPDPHRSHRSRARIVAAAPRLPLCRRSRRRSERRRRHSRWSASLPRASSAVSALPRCAGSTTPPTRRLKGVGPEEGATSSATMPRPDAAASWWRAPISSRAGRASRSRSRTTSGPPTTGAS